MNARQIELLVTVGVGVLIGNYLTYNHMAKKYNLLAQRYNRLVEKDAIKARVFKEVLPQLPDDYNLTEQTIIDIKTVLMFEDNDM